MKINIFGVGRSGTKAVQLYLSYLSAKKNGKVKTNYEPYYWQDRFLINTNYEGIFSHLKDPLFLNDLQNFNSQHRRLLLKLINSTGNFDIVNKFIRANGRIKAINELLQPDYTIIVIRDLYEVLNSLYDKNWDLLGEGLRHPNDWEKLVYEVKRKDIVPDFNTIINKIKSDLDKNAFYWYVMNLVALENRGENFFFIDFENLNLIDTIADVMSLRSGTESIYNQRFKGNNLHTTYPLQSKLKKKCYLKMGFNYFLMRSRLFKLGFQFQYKKIGTLNHLNSTPKDKASNKIDFKKKDNNIKNNELYDFFNNDIKSKLKNKEN